ncbi:MAG: hypothetical protein QNJ29_05210, partial [Rhizobiaceae bacterium]|nr:hypothetical protein [Rhizobiaceae bacterium]
MQSKSLTNLGSTSAMFLVSFLITLVFAVLLLQIGSPVFYISILLFIFVVSSYVFGGFVGGTMALDDFQYGNKSGQPRSVAMSIGSGIIASGIFVTLAGSFYSQGTDALATFWGWLLGIVLMTILFSAGMARSQSLTASQTIAEDIDSPSLRLLSALAVLCSGGLLAITQFAFLGQVGEQFLSIPSSAVMTAASIALGICLVFSGIQGVSVIRAASYPVILLIFLAPLIWVTINTSSVIIPQFAFGTGALQPVADINREVLDAGLATPDEVFDFATESAGLDAFNYLATLLCIGCAIAAMPHLLQHFKMIRTGREARKTGFQAFGLVFLFLSAIPAVAAFVQVDIYTSILGLQIGDLESDAGWVFDLSGAGALPLIKLCGALVATVEEAVSACGGSSEYFISIADITIDPELLTLSQGILHQLPELLTIVLAIGALLAIMTTLDGVVLSMGLCFENDGYLHLFRPKSPKNIRLFMSRVFLVAVLAALASIAVFLKPDPRLSFEFAMAITASTLFPMLLVRFWYPATSARVRLVSLLLSFVLCAFAIWGANFGPDMMTNTGDE